MPDPTASPQIPYQAYKPKRHSRGPSSNSNGHLLPSVTPPPVSMLAAVAHTPPFTPSPLSQSEKDDFSTYVFPGHPQHTSPIIALTNGLPSPPASNHSHESQDSPIDNRTSSNLRPFHDSTEQKPAYVQALSPNASTASAIASTSSSPVASGSAPATPDTGPSSLPFRKASKFRRIPLHKPHVPVPSSPVVLPSQEPHSRTGSVSSLPPQQRDTEILPIPSHLNQSEPQLTTAPPTNLSPPPPFPRTSERSLPSLPLEEVKPETIQQPVVPVIWTSSPTTGKNSSLSSNSPARPSTPSAPGHKSNTSRSLTPNRLSIPYRPGFQPKGVIRDLTDDFLAIRKLKSEGVEGHIGMKKVERNKLERRLEKLINLHFPVNPPPSTPESSTNSSGSAKRRPGLGSSTDEIRRTLSIFDFDTLKNISIRDAGDLWKNVLTGNLGDNTKPDIRDMEQRITPWEEDSAVSKCPLCLSSFHPLTNRKHHCRLCGRIICSLPPKNPQRPATCSILFVVDSKTRRIEEVDEGVDYGVKKRRNAGVGKADEIDNNEKFLKGVRICRDCRPILLREQYQQERLHVPIFVRLHEAFIALEHEIEGVLPQFQELVVALNHNDQPSKEASVARKRLLEAFGQYDALAKKISQLPCPSGPGSSQGRIQSAILMRANLFLQKNMFPLQSLPKPSINKGKEPAGSSTPNSSNLGDGVEERVYESDSALAQTLQPLLEQEALLETFIEEAMAQRKFEDVKTLKANLQEIRREIEKLLDGVDVNTKKGKGRNRG